jgi:CPA1 family monovalent cation:H+ antiporter
VVVFLALLGVVTRGEASPGDVAMLFLREAGGVAVLGLALGNGVYRMIKSVDNYQVEILLTLALVMGGYGLADALHASRPIAVVIAGLVTGNHGRSFGMSERTLERIDTFWEPVGELLNAIPFVLIGLEVLVLSFRAQYLEAALSAIPIVLAARWLSVGVPVRLFRFFREITTGATLIMTWGGLRGGVSVALALSLPQSEARDAIVTVTYAVVAFSILVQGLTLGRVIGSSAASAEASQGR